MSPLISRLLALALLVVMVWAAYAFVAEPLVTRYRTTAQSISDMERLVQRYRDIGASRRVLEEQLAAAEERLSPAGLYLRSGGDALVAAELQNRVKAVIEANGGKLNSTQILPARDEGNFRRVAIRVQMTVLIEPLQRILYELEAGQPYLLLDNVDMRRRVARRRVANRPLEDENQLTVRFDLYGYSRNEAT